MLKILLTALVLSSFQDIDYLARQALNEYNKGNYEASLVMSSQVLELDTLNQNVRFNKASALLKLKRPEEAISDLTRIIRDAGDVPMVLVQRAIAYAQLGRPDMGVADLSTAIAKDSTFPRAHFLRARMRAQSGHGDQAAICADLKKAAQLGEPEAKKQLDEQCK